MSSKGRNFAVKICAISRAHFLTW